MSSMTGLEKDLAAAFVTAFGKKGRALPFAKGRVALYAGLKALSLPPGSRVILPAYTCVVVPSAIQFAGLKPVYADIDPNTFNIDPRNIPAGEALLVQHTYGIPADMDALKSFSGPVIEDCCHVFASSWRGQRCGTFGDFAFFSGQWNKFFSSGLGGFLYTQSSDLATKTEKLLEEAPMPGALSSLRFALQIMAYDLLVTPSTEALVTRLYRAMTATGLAAGSSSPAELEGREPQGYFSRMAPPQLKKAIAGLGRVQDNIAHRRRLGAFYHERLKDLGFEPVKPPEESDTVFLRYPVRVGNKAELLEKAARAGIEIGSWFETPLHGNKAPLETFGYRLGSCPHAEKAARETINLPTHLKITEEYAEKILTFLKKEAEAMVRTY